MFKAIAAIATALAAIATMATALVVLMQTQEANRADPPPGVERPATPLPGDAQPASLEGEWFYDGGSLDIYFDSTDDGMAVYAYDDYDTFDSFVGSGALAINVDEGLAIMVGVGGPCGEDMEYEGELYLLDSWGIEGELICILTGGTRGMGYYR